MAFIGPLAPFQRALADLSNWGFREQLEQARAERDALISELGYAVTHPLEVLGNIGSEYAEKWRRFEALSTEQTLAARFDAGRIFGEVLLDVVGLIGGGAAAAKAAAKIPRLAKLARMRAPAKSAHSAAAAEAAAAREAPVTPSQVRPAAPTAEGVPKTPPLRAKGLVEVDRDGVPIGARQGKAVKGLPRKTLSKEGWPDLPGKEAANFNSAEPITLPPGTKLYRVIEDPAKGAGGYWSETLPTGRAEWRRDYAVLEQWNGNGQYVEYTVPDGPGLKVWRGETAAQQYDGMNFYLPGGGQQIWMVPGKIVPSAAKPTGW
jgi:hypothetical protein